VSLSIEEPQLLVGVSAGLNSIHTIIVREEADGRLRLMGEHRNRQVVPRPDEEILIRRVHESIEKAIEDAQVDLGDIGTIGVASPGQIDIDNGTVLFSPLFEVKEDPFPFVAKLRDYLDVPHITLINNDDAPGIGEQRIGEGRGIKDLVYLRVGYNLGAGIIIDEKLYTGADNLAGVFGHMIVDLNGPECTCGNRGCLDVLASRAAIEKKLLQYHREGKATILASALEKEPLDINSAVIAEAIDQEDLLTYQVVEEAAEVLGIGIANVINFLNPHRVILGGDVIDEIDLFFEKAVKSAKKRSLHASMRNVSIVRGNLGTMAVAYGAAVFAKERLLQTREQQSTQA
jgi:predicted NBD/HSP70 family sugar kinase